jgi:hypothetical protein
MLEIKDQNLTCGEHGVNSDGNSPKNILFLANNNSIL